MSPGSSSIPRGAVDDDVRFESEVAGVEHAVFDAVIQSQTHKVDVLDGALL